MEKIVSESFAPEGSLHSIGLKDMLFSKKHISILLIRRCFLLKDFEWKLHSG